MTEDGSVRPEVKWDNIRPISRTEARCIVTTILAALERREADLERRGAKAGFSPVDGR